MSRTYYSSSNEIEGRNLTLQRAFDVIASCKLLWQTRENCVFSDGNSLSTTTTTTKNVKELVLWNRFSILMPRSLPSYRTQARVRLLYFLPYTRIRRARLKLKGKEDWVNLLNCRIARFKTNAGVSYLRTIEKCLKMDSTFLYFLVL